jgi:hypothetical protein
MTFSPACQFGSELTNVDGSAGVPSLRIMRKVNIPASCSAGAANPEWIAAIFGIVGTVVGATVTGGVDYLLERRREQALIRQAKMLVADELHTAWIQLPLMAEEKRTPRAMNEEMAARFLPTDLWHRFKATLALKGVLER